MPPAEQVRSRSSSDADLRAESAAIDATLDAWRRKASDILLVVVAAAHLPVIVLGWLGHGPPMGSLPKTVGLAVYLVVAAAALFRWVEYRRRVWVSILALYPALFIATLVAPHGPYAQIGVVTMPVFALVLLGAGAARTAILASAAIVVSAPFLWGQPGIVRALGIAPAQVANPAGLVWFQTTVKIASLFGLMALLDRFHRLLLSTLTERISAHRKLQREMRERQRLEREIAGIGDEERRRLGQELHDGVCQQVTAALLRCQGLELRLRRGGMLSEADFAPLSALLAETIDDAHDVARGLCPLDGEADALAPALRALTKRTQEMAGVHCEFLATGDVGVPDREMAQHFYRIGQESLSNAARHAKATRITVELRGTDCELILQVEDDGAGLPAEPSGRGMGMRTMAYRAQILEGELSIAPAPGGGTRIICRVPRRGSIARPAHQASGEERWIPAT